MNKYSILKGFTLIEIMVVISIVSILSAVIYANFNDARILSKNKIMQSEVKEIQLALELYKAQNNRYPVAIADLVPNYTQALPDANNSNNTNCVMNYDTDSDGTYYKFTADRCYAGAADNTEGVQPGDVLAVCLFRCGNPPSSGVGCDGASGTPVSYATFILTDKFYESYGVYSLGGECR